MLKRMIVLTLLMVALQVRAYEPTANNTFTDEHFIKDSLLVMASGAVYGSGIEAFCYQLTPPEPNRAFYCKTFAAESLALINLFEAQQPVWTLATCRNLNLLLVVIASGYIGSTQFQSETISTVLASVLCYQLGRISADCAAHHLWKPDLDNLKPVLVSYLTLNGVSTGLLIGDLILWYRQNLEGGLNSLVLILGSTSTALLSTVVYMIIIEPEEPFSILERVTAVAVAVALVIVVVAAVLTGVLAGTVAIAVGMAVAIAEAMAVAIAKAEAIAIGIGVAVVVAEAVTVASLAKVEAIVGALAGAGAVAIAKAGAIAKAEAAVGTIAIGIAVTVGGAVAGLLIIITTRFSLRRLSNGEQPHSINHHLAQAALISVPFLVTSWLLSVNQWVMNNVPAHETMQRIYYPNTARAFFSGEWTEALYHLLWLNE